MRDTEIREWIQSLVSSLGEPRRAVNEAPLRALYAAKDFVGMVRTVREHMRLDVRLRVGFANSGGPPAAPAWVRVPEPMPAYGTKEFKETTITIFLRKSFLAEARFGTVVVAISHEMSHIVLDAIGHPLNKQEEAVDLTAMLLGYQKFFLRDSEYEERREIYQRPRPAGLRGLLVALVPSLDEEPDIELTKRWFGYLSQEERLYAAQLLRR